jgi:hypothetical protein
MTDETKVPVAETAVVVASHYDLLDTDPGRARKALKAIKDFQAVCREVLVEGLDYGTIPGCGDKPSLFKPGAEKISKLLNLFEEYEFVERIEDWDKPLFHYVIRCTLRDIASGVRVASGLGECNSWESKYRYRWVAETQLTESEKIGALKRGGIQTLFEPKFAVEKKEASGRYGKPAEHWQRFEDAIRDGKARQATKEKRDGGTMAGWEIDVDTTLYRVPNPEIFDQVNTMVKIAKKRAQVDATLSAGRLSELFTQDLEDLVDAVPESLPRPAPVAAPAASSPAQGSGSSTTSGAPKPAPVATPEPPKSGPKPATAPAKSASKPAAAPPASKPAADPGPEPSDADFALLSEEEAPDALPLDPITPKRLCQIFDRVKAVKERGKFSDEKVYGTIGREVKKNFNLDIAEMSDVTNQIGDFILDLLLRWENFLKNGGSNGARS